MARHLTEHRVGRLAVSVGKADRAVLTPERLAAELGTTVEGERTGLGQFLVMSRTHSNPMWELEVDPKVTADQLGHSVGVNQNVYTQANLNRRLEAGGWRTPAQPPTRLNGPQTDYGFLSWL